jgi:Flp pilus assembly protein TadD
MRLIVLALASLIYLVPIPAVAAASSAVTHPEAQAALEQGRGFDRQFDVERAHAAYLTGTLRDSTSYELWWRLAHAAGDRGMRAEFNHDKPRAEAAYAEAVHAARKAVALEPNDWEGHMELAANLGRYALFQGGKNRLRLSKEVKAEADRTLELNPRADRADHVLARWNRAIAQLSFFEKAGAKVIYGGVPKGATMNHAVTLFEKAIALAPNYAHHRLELGRTYLDLGLKDKAREQLERALQSPRENPFDPEFKAEARRLLEKAR